MENNTEKFNLPKTKIERIDKLQKAINILKSEFVGLDDIIEKIKLSVTPWYVTPEVITRPVVVSLWGMTGTGKSSVVKRLLELLGLYSKSIFFDCGRECSENDNDVASKAMDFLNVDNIDDTTNNLDVDNLVFVFDEFQYARTISESGEELSKPNLRPVWNIIDSGIINVTESDYELGQLTNFLEDLKDFAKEHPEIHLNNCMVENPDEVKLVLEALGFFYFQRGVPGLMESGIKRYYDEYDENFDDKENKENPYRPLRIIENRLLRTMIKKLYYLEHTPGKQIIEELSKLTTLGELVGYLEERKQKIKAPKIIDCSKSLVFIIGNLDEAFRVEGDLSPDFDADIFYDETSKVTISDIKEALKSRFRAEQIARFGNSIIKYPTLKSEHFKKIIKKEVDKICNNFRNDSGISIQVTNDVYDILYSEGVYPVQGVRPVFTTIGTMFTPLLSEILIHSESDFNENILIGVVNPEAGYKKSTKNIFIDYLDSKQHEEVTTPMFLGELRDPENRKNRFIASVHETGHAILLTYLTGVIPTSIVSVSTDKGGFCTTYDPSKVNEIRSRKDIMNDVMVSLGGYCAEELIYENDLDRTLLGAGSDIESAWDELSDAAFKLGYFEPYSFANCASIPNSDGIPSGIESRTELDAKIKFEFNRLKEKTVNILKENKDLLKKFALELGERGSLSGDVFYKFICENGDKNTLNKDRIELAKKENSSDWYKSKLLE